MEFEQVVEDLLGGLEKALRTIEASDTRISSAIEYLAKADKKKTDTYILQIEKLSKRLDEANERERDLRKQNLELIQASREKDRRIDRLTDLLNTAMSRGGANITNNSNN